MVVSMARFSSCIWRSRALLVAHARQPFIRSASLRGDGVPNNCALLSFMFAFLVNGLPNANTLPNHAWNVNNYFRFFTTIGGASLTSIQKRGLRPSDQ